MVKIPGLESRLTELRREATTSGLTPGEVNALLSLRFNGKPAFEAEAHFLNPLFKRAMTDEEAAKLLSIRRGDSYKYGLGDVMCLNSVGDAGWNLTLTLQQAADLYGAGMAKQYRPATQEEANLLYIDTKVRNLRRY